MKRIALLAFLVAGCGKEIGRIPFKDAGTGSAMVTLDANKSVDFWVQLDVKFSGTLPAHFEISLTDGSGGTVGSVTCNAFSHKVRRNSYISNITDPKVYRLEGKMAGCTLSSTSAGTYTVNAMLAIGPKPADLVINDFSLVVKE